MASASLILGLSLLAGPAGRASDPCDAPEVVRAALADLAVEDLSRPEREGDARAVAALRRFADAHPGEPLAWRRLIETRRQVGEDAAAIAGELAERGRRRPSDPVAAYAAALAAGLADQREGARQLEALVERAPDLIEARLSLQRWYRSGPARDETRLAQQVDALTNRCPDSVRLARDLPRDGERTARAAAALRARMDKVVPADPEVVRWLWSLGAGRRAGGRRGAAALDRGALLAQMKKDLARIRGSALAARPAFLPVLAYGYRLARDPAGRRWAEDRIARRLPATLEAGRIALRRFFLEHPEPLPIDPPQARRDHARALLAASARWIERWPGWPVAWERRLAALRRLPPERAVAVQTARAAVAAMDKHPRALRTESLAVQLAYLCRQSDIALAEVPGLAERVAAAAPVVATAAAPATAAASVAVAPAPPALAKGPAPAKVPASPPAPESATPPIVRFVLDTRQFSDLAPWATSAARLCEAWYPLIVEVLSTEGFVPPAEIKMVYRTGMTVPGQTSGRTLELNGDDVRRRPGNVGMVIHELTHTVQGFGGGPTWLTEGIADYIRWHVFERPQLARVNPATASYEDGYRVTAAFLAWAATNHDPRLVRRLNAALRASAYDDELFRVFTGHDLDTLWQRWLAAGAPAEMGPDAPRVPPATFEPPATGS